MAEDKKKVDKIVEGQVQIRKQSTGEKVLKTFFPGDIRDVLKSMCSTVLLPALKRTVYDFFTEGLDGLLYPGEPRASRSRVPSGSRISYDQQYGRRDVSTRPRGISQWDRDFDFSQVLFDDRSDAEAVISGLEANLREYPFVSAAVFYELAGITTDNYQLNKYGWTDLRTASVIRDFRTGKFYIHLPKPLPID